MRRLFFALVSLALLAARAPAQSQGREHDRARAIRLVQQGKGQEALPLLDELVANDPSDGVALIYRGLARRRKHDYPGAIADFHAAMKTNRQSPVPYFNICDALANMLQFKEALIYCEQGMDLLKKQGRAVDAPHCVHMGYALAGLGRADEALAEFHQAERLIGDGVAINQQSAGGGYGKIVKLGLAWSYHRKGDPKRAGPLFDAVIAEDPSFAEAYARRGDFHKSHNRTTEAIADYGKALELDPDWGAVHAARGGAYEDAGDKERAKADHAKACSLGWKPACKKAEPLPR